MHRTLTRLTVVFLTISLKCIYCADNQTSSVADHVCNTTVVEESVMAQVNITVPCLETFESTCGFWFGKKSCTKTRFSYCINTTYEFVTVNITVNLCCNGWSKDINGYCSIQSIIESTTMELPVLPESNATSNVTAALDIADTDNNNNNNNDITNWLKDHMTVGTVAGGSIAACLLAVAGFAVCLITCRRHRQKLSTKRRSVQCQSFIRLDFVNTSNTNNVSAHHIAELMALRPINNVSTTAAEGDLHPAPDLDPNLALLCNSVQTSPMKLLAKTSLTESTLLDNSNLATTPVNESSDMLPQPVNNVPHMYLTAGSSNSINMSTVPQQQQSEHESTNNALHLSPNPIKTSEDSTVVAANTVQETNNRKPRRFVRKIPLASTDADSSSSSPNSPLTLTPSPTTLPSNVVKRQHRQNRGFSLEKLGLTFKRPNSKRRQQTSLGSSTSTASPDINTSLVSDSDVEASGLYGQYAELRDVDNGGAQLACSDFTAKLIAEPYAVCAVVDSQSNSSLVPVNVSRSTSAESRRVEPRSPLPPPRNVTGRRPVATNSVGQQQARLPLVNKSTNPTPTRLSNSNPRDTVFADSNEYQLISGDTGRYLPMQGGSTLTANNNFYSEIGGASAASDYAEIDTRWPAAASNSNTVAGEKYEEINFAPNRTSCLSVDIPSPNNTEEYGSFYASIDA